MGLRINQNIAAFNAYRNLSVTDGMMAKSLEKLSSGFRINRAADDAAGLAISEGLRSQIGGLKMAVRNAQDGVSVIQTGEGALTEVHSMLQRMRDLTVQAGNVGANGGLSSEAVKDIQIELDNLIDAINDVATRTQFNGTKLLNGSVTTLTFQVGANGGETVAVNLLSANVLVTALGTGATPGFISSVKTGGTNVVFTTTATVTSVSSQLTIIDAAIKQVSGARAALGGAQNRMDYTINSLNIAVENLAASESRIRDADMALEMVEFTRNQILNQAGTAMLAQANQLPSGVLQLLR